MRRSLPILVVGALLGLTGCADKHSTEDDGDTPVTFDATTVPAADGGSMTTPGSDAGTVEPGECVGDERRSGFIFYGTSTPTHVPLSTGQIQSVVSFGGCSGMLIADSWVLTARHCGIRPGRELCIGVSPTNSDVCFTAASVVNEPGGNDLTLVELDAPASSRAAWAEPVPILTEIMDDSWLGRTAEASGFGQQETGASGEREFTAEPIVSLRGSSVSIDGEGTRGVCFGDSGGPLFAIASDASVRVIGALSGGDESCVGVDNFTRTDVFRDWIESNTGPTIVDGASCGSITETGRCVSGAAVYCSGDELQREVCEGGETCGWDAGADAYRCIAEGTDPCEGLDSVGECAGNVARWCEGGVVRSRDCGSCDQVCANIDEVGGAYCQPDACAGVDYLGRCDGDVAVWCQDGALQQLDCAAAGRSCGYINDDIGYYCGRRRR
ncbi:MAG: hypothetical protein CMN30_06255 [Sandaracinus sp.]|mgnify:CR=1 FL=1|nr:hypothetical protein [Sandaracinus sp.]|tara:strand:- start:85 stop:1404 length:1320 start_codon:yes stop_codon:yes gene_type:complete